MTGAVEPITPHPVPRVPLLGYRVAKGVGRHRLVKRGVEHRDLRQVGQNVTDSLDAGEIRRVVKRRQVTKRPHRGDHSVVHQDRRSEPLTAVHHPMTGPEQANGLVPGFGQVIQHAGHDSPMSAIGKPFLNRLCRKPLDPQQRLRRAQPLADSPHQTFPTPGTNNANLTDELPELSTNTKPPEFPSVPWSGLAVVIDIFGILMRASAAEGRVFRRRTCERSAVCAATCSSKIPARDRLPTLDAVTRGPGQAIEGRAGRTTRPPRCPTTSRADSSARRRRRKGRRRRRNWRYGRSPRRDRC